MWRCPHFKHTLDSHDGVKVNGLQFYCPLPFFLVALLSLTPEGLPAWKYFFFVGTGLGWVGGAAGITGICLGIVLCIMILCSLPCVRRKGHFQVSGECLQRQWSYSCNKIVGCAVSSWDSLNV